MLRPDRLWDGRLHLVWRKNKLADRHFEFARLGLGTHTIESVIMGPVSVQLRLESVACFFWDLPWAHGAVSPIAVGTYLVWFALYVMIGYVISTTFASALLPKPATRDRFGMRSQTWPMPVALIVLGWLVSTMNWIVTRREFMEYRHVWCEPAGLNPHALEPVNLRPTIRIRSCGESTPIRRPSNT